MVQNISQLILYNNNQLLALNKPSSIPIQADQTQDKDLISIAQAYTKHPLYLTHRIDRPTSGVVLIAKNKSAQSHINLQFQSQSIQKSYLAIVKNKPKNKTGLLQHHIIKGRNNKSIVLDKEQNSSQLATLTYTHLANTEYYHLLHIKPSTGRHHQIRAQLSFVGSPIKGDVKYGARRKNKDRSIHLHAYSISFLHPITNQITSVIAPIPNQDNLWAAFAETISNTDFSTI